MKRSGRGPKDPDLIACYERLRGGDRGALADFIRLTQERLYRFCLYLTGKPDLAEDLCHDAYVKALQGLVEAKDASNLYSWLIRIAQNTFIDHQRLHSTQNELLEREPASDEAPGLISQAPDPRAIDLDSSLTVAQVLGRLKPEERLILVMIDSEGRSYEEAAQALGVTEEAVRARISRARKAFCEAFRRG